MSYYNTKSISRIMPEVAHKNEASGRVHLNRLIFTIFNMAEIVLITGIFTILYIFRISVEFGYQGYHQFLIDLPRFKEYASFYFVTILSYYYWTYHYHRISQSSNNFSDSFISELSKDFRAISYAVLTSIGIAFLLKILIYSRLVVVLFWIMSLFGSLLIRGIKRILTLSLAKKGILSRNILVVGAGKIGELLLDEFLKDRGLGSNVIGFVDDEKAGTEFHGIKVLGTTKELKKLIYRYPVDEIIITIPSERDIVNEIIREYRKYNITIRIIPEMFNLVLKSLEIGNISALPYVTLVKTPMRGLNLFIKRILEWLMSGVGLVLLFPIMLLISIAIKLDSKGPILYKQKRVGKDGKFFFMYKFRSMIVDADELIGELLFQNESDGLAFKIKDDPRITRVGKLIRKYSLDELPQLLNVLRGEMAFIGPRPPLPREVTQYGDWEWRRLEVLPGITGLWQVSGRSDLSFENWMNLDIYYIENWSFALDLKILLKTIPAVFKGEGAY